MEDTIDSSWCEPLNLVKKKTKPVAVVAPSAVFELSENKGYEESNNEKNNEINENRLLIKKDIDNSENSPDEESNRVQYDKVMRRNEDEPVKDINKETSDKEAESNTSINNGGVYSMFHNLATCEQNFLTALYMGSLMNSRYAPGTTSANIPSFPYPGLTNPSLFSGQWPPPASVGSDTGPNSQTFSPLLAQQRFWQMVNWAEAQKSNSTSDQNLKNLTSVTESLSITVPPIDQSLPVYTKSDSTSGSSAVAKSKSNVSQSDANNSTTNINTNKKTKSNRSSSMDRKNSSSVPNDGSKSQESGHMSNNNQEKKPHIKKPLNAFMLYMKEMRAKVVAECTLKESAAINQILGRRWHSLTREEQAKYYEKARQERQLHMELYPGWSARDNYGYGAKKKKRKKERVPIADTGGREEQAKYYELARRERQLHMQLYPDWSSRANATRGKKRKRKQETNDGGNNMKKCRARYGLDQQSQWCKPCRRKKKCIRYMESGEDGNQSEDNLGSCGSVGEAQTPPEEDTESFHHSMSSPGGLSGLSSLTSPSMILPSPSASLASPSVSLASPCMSLQSPLTPHALDFAECNSIVNKPPPPPCLPLLINHHLAVVQPQHRNPVGTNPHDINNPLSVNQLTGKCIKNSSSSPSSSSATGSNKESTSRPVISVP